MFTISKDTPALYFTSVAAHRLPIFKTDKLKQVTCLALDEARLSEAFLLFAYVIMPDHIHGIAGSELKPSRTMQYINGIISRLVINYLKENGYQSSLDKLRHEERERRYRYSLWEHHSNTMLLTSESVFMQRVNYIHNNPVRAELSEHAESYRWSSVRWWRRTPWEDEPLNVDIEQISWRLR